MLAIVFILSLGVDVGDFFFLEVLKRGVLLVKVTSQYFFLVRVYLFILFYSFNYSPNSRLK